MEPVTIIVGSILFGWITKKIVDYKKENTKQKKLKAKSQIDLAKIQAAQKDNEKAQKEQDEWKKKYEELEEKEKQAEKKIKELEGRINNPNLSPEERNKLVLQIAALQDELRGIRDEKKGVLSKIKDLGTRIAKNNSIISSVDSSNLNEGYQLQDFLNLETAMIVVALYIAYQLLLKDDRK